MSKEVKIYTLITVVMVGIIVAAGVFTSFVNSNESAFKIQAIAVAEAGEVKTTTIDNSSATVLEVPHPLLGVWVVYSDCFYCHGEGNFFSSKPPHSLEGEYGNCSSCHTVIEL